MIVCGATLPCSLHEYVDVSKCLVQELDVRQLELIKDQNTASFHSQEQMELYGINGHGSQSSFPYLLLPPVKQNSGLNKTWLVSQDI